MHTCFIEAVVPGNSLYAIYKYSCLCVICVHADGYGVPNGVNGNGSVVVSGTITSGPEAGVRQSNSLLIVDARSYAAAVANRAKGGGCECQGRLCLLIYITRTTRIL